MARPQASTTGGLGWGSLLYPGREAAHPHQLRALTVGASQRRCPFSLSGSPLEKLGTRGLGTRGDRGKMEDVGCSRSSWVSGWGYVCCGCCVKQQSEVKVTRSCPTLCNPPGLYGPWNSPGQNTGVGSLFLLQGIFPTQGLNPGLPHCRQILYQLSHKGSPVLEWVAYPFSSGSSRPRNQPGVSCIAGGFFTN